jgi:hypothetical protein
MSVTKIEPAFRAADTGAGTTKTETPKPALNILGLPMGHDGDTAGGQNKTGWINVGCKLRPHP